MRNTDNIENSSVSTTIAISRVTKRLLASFGKFGDSYDDIIQNLMRQVTEAKSNEP